MSKIKTVVIIYWALLLYIFSFIIFWVIKIEKQNKEIASLKKQIVIIQNNTHNVSPETIIEIDTMNHVRKIQFYSEGVFFLLLIFISAIFIYRNIHRVWKFNLQQKNILRI
ncbi:MAG: hypothetical protein ORN85_05830, partial [Sediminibacterium sp.]|nr:hypothetical protein [Sediminibacterium sp.]